MAATVILAEVPPAQMVAGETGCVVIAGSATTVYEAPALIKSQFDELVVTSLYWYKPAAVVPEIVIAALVLLV